MSIIFLPVTHHFDYCGFAVSFSIRICKSFKLVFLFQVCFACSEFLTFPYEFCNQLVNSAKIQLKVCRDCHEFADQFVEYFCFNNMKSSDPWTWYEFPFIQILFNFLTILYSFNVEILQSFFLFLVCLVTLIYGYFVLLSVIINGTFSHC